MARSIFPQILSLAMTSAQENLAYDFVAEVFWRGRYREQCHQRR